ncbi:MAG: hypothetical protein ACOYZ6_05775 [Chloroflexota bacterium]
MKANDGSWDVRCPDKLKRLFPNRTGYYFRVDHNTATKVLDILSEAYQISAPKLKKIPNGSKENALYEYETGTVLLFPRAHLRTVFHEFYHHLENMTDGLYNSDDREGGLASFAWMFADKLWKIFAEKNSDLS